MYKFVCIGLLAGLAPGISHAEWLESSSAHFIIYADENERDLRMFSQQLERFHAAISLVTNSKPPIPSASNRVTVYVVASVRQVRKLYGDDARYVGALGVRWPSFRKFPRARWTWIPQCSPFFTNTLTIS